MNRNLDYLLSKLIEEIEHIEDTRQRFGAVMTDLKKQININRFPSISSTTFDTSFVKEISPVNLSGLRIAGIDGGLVRKRFHSMELFFTRGVAVVFQFGFESGPLVDFYPEAFPEPQVKPVALTLSGIELDQLASLERVALELKVTLSVLEEFHTDLILLDGSLYFHPRDRPQSGSIVWEKFQEVLALYKRLYHQARKKRTILVGVVKDSRSTRVVNILGDILPHILKDRVNFEKMKGIDYRWLLKVSRDCDILDTFLEEGERTFAFRYSTELNQASNAFDGLTALASSIWVTYARTAREDLPLRFEILASDDQQSVSIIDKALAAILPLSSQHSEYGVPAPILEADARARISKNEARLVVDRLMALSGLTYTFLEKRRSRNPFGGV